MNLSIGKKITGSFLLLTVFIIGIGALSIYHLGIIEFMVYNRLMEKANSRSIVKDITIKIGSLSNLLDQFYTETNPPRKHALKINIEDDITILNIYINQISSHQLEKNEKEIISALTEEFRLYQQKIMHFINNPAGGNDLRNIGLKFATSLAQVDKLETELMYEAWASAKSRINFIKNSLLAFIFITIGIALLLSYLNSRSVLRPIQNLVKVLDRYGNGNFSIRAEVTGSDEIGFFARRFNMMLSQIDSYADGIRRSNFELQQKNREIEESRMRLRIITDAAPDAIIVVDKQYRIAEVNTTTERLFGYSASSLSGAALSILSVDDITDRIESAAGGVPGNNSEAPEFEWQFTRIGGESFTALIRIRKMVLENKDFYLLIITDISDKKRSEETISRQYIEIQYQYEKLEKVNEILARTFEDLKTANKNIVEEKEKMETTLRSLGEGVITADTEGTILYMNRAAENITGYGSHYSLGKPVSEIFLIRDPDTSYVFSSGDICSAHSSGILNSTRKVILSSRDGDERIISPIIAQTKDRPGSASGIVIVFRDITENVKLEEELIKASKIESLGLIAGGIAHDFNNLLTSILGNISLARLNTGAGDKYHEVLAEAEKVALRTMDLTYQLLTFSKGGLPIITTVSIQNLLTETSTFVLRGSNVKPEYNFDEGLWNVSADEGQIGQVVQNIVFNARDAMSSGGEILIAARNCTVTQKENLPLHPDDYVKISIKDTGTGIPRDIIQKIFDPYFTTKQSGHGLGLAVTYSIVKKHNGHITAESEPGSGSTFTIYLPAHKSSIEESPHTAENISFTGRRLLLMDDEQIILSVGRKMFGHLGFEVSCASDGKEALLLYKDALDSGRPFDITVIDLTIPGGMGGKETIIRLLHLDPGVKAIVSSGYSNDPVMANYRDYGFSGVMIKPYRLDDLKKILLSCMQ